MVAKIIKRKKNTKTVKEELLNSLRERDFNIQNMTDQREAIERIKTENKNTIRYESIQGQMLKKIKDTEGFVKNSQHSRSTIYFKIELYKLLKKYPTFKNSSQSSHYFRNNFKMIKTVCKSNKELFA